MTDKMTEYELEELETFKQEETFKIKDLEAANWAFKKILALEKKQEENKNLAAKELDRINNWLKKENEHVETSISYFDHVLAEYFKEEKKKDPKFKLKTPYGKVMSRKQQPEWTIDNKKAIEYLELEKPEMIVIEKKYNKTEFKKLVKLIDSETGKKAIDLNGEVLKFVKLEERPDNIIVKTENLD